VTFNASAKKKIAFYRVLSGNPVFICLGLNEAYRPIQPISSLQGSPKNPSLPSLSRRLLLRRVRGRWLAPKGAREEGEKTQKRHSRKKRVHERRRETHVERRENCCCGTRRKE